MTPPVLPALHAVSVGDPIAYPPVELIDGYCVGNSSCFLGTLDNNDGMWLHVPAMQLGLKAYLSSIFSGIERAGTGNWAACRSSDLSSCEALDIPPITLLDGAKYKGLLLCG